MQSHCTYVVCNGVRPRTYAAIVVGLLIGSVFFDLSLSQGDAHSRIGMLFYVLTFAVFGAVQLVPTFVAQRCVPDVAVPCHWVAMWGVVLVLQLIRGAVVVMSDVTWSGGCDVGCNVERWLCVMLDVRTSNSGAMLCGVGTAAHS